MFERPSKIQKCPGRVAFVFHSFRSSKILQKGEITCSISGSDERMEVPGMTPSAPPSLLSRPSLRSTEVSGTSDSRNSQDFSSQRRALGAREVRKAAEKVGARPKDDLLCFCFGPTSWQGWGPRPGRRGADKKQTLPMGEGPGFLGDLMKQIKSSIDWLSFLFGLSWRQKIT